VSQEVTGRRFLGLALLWWLCLGVDLFLFFVLRPGLLLSATLTAGGDTGAHVALPAYAGAHIFSHFSLTGWSWEWFAGFPLYTFYFPLPALVTVALSHLISYDVAFKLVTVLGSFALPFALGALARAAKLSGSLQAATVLVALVYLFGTTYTVDGGNLASTLAGEYDFSLALSLGIFFLARVVAGLDRPRDKALGAVLLATSMLSHAIPALFVATVAVLWMLSEHRVRRIGQLAFVGFVGAGLVAFWLLPLGADFGYTGSLNYANLTDVRGALLPAFLIPWMFLGAYGGVRGLMRRNRYVTVWLMVVVLSALAFLFIPSGAIYNGRVLPFYTLGIELLSAIGAVWLIQDLLALVARRWHALADGWAVVPFALLIAVTVIVPLFPGVADAVGATPSFVPDWIAWNYSGYQGKASWPQYHALMTTMGHLGATYGCGRAMWEYSPMENDYGTTMSLMLLPYFTNGCVDSMEGLLFESSATTPYHFLDQSELSADPSEAERGLAYSGVNVALGIQHLQMWGVKYFMAFSPEIVYEANRNHDLTLVGEVAPTTHHDPSIITSYTWMIYRVGGESMVHPLAHPPTVWRNVTVGQWQRFAVSWYLHPADFSFLGLADGPKGFARRRAGTVVRSSTRYPSDRVSDLKIAAESVSFDVSRIGVPVEVAASYFPNWSANGASGPYRATPNEMVVVPNSHHVTLRYLPTLSDKVGDLVSWIAWLTVAVWLARDLAVTWRGARVVGRTDAK